MTNITSNQLRAGCALLNIATHKLARRAGVGTRTIDTALAHGGLLCLGDDTRGKILEAFRRHGLSFTASGVELVGAARFAGGRK
jgi:DNA-binding LacI/PurR family transcriptional regulator